MDEYDKYLRGDIYGYVATTQDGEHEDSCWGFVGYEYAMEEAKSAAEYLAKTYLTPELPGLEATA